MTNSRARGNVTVRVKKADETKNANITLASDAELILPLAISTTYAFEMTLWFVSGTVPDLKIKFNLPSGATGTRLTGDTLNTPATTVNVVTEYFYATSGSLQYAIIQGIIIMSTTQGNLDFTWAQNTSEASNTTIKAGSSLKLWKT